MTVSEKHSSKMLSVVELVKNTVQLYKKHFGIFLGYSAWLLVPMAANVLLNLSPQSDYTETILGVIAITEIIIMAWVFISITQIASLEIKEKTINAQKISTTSWRLVLSLMVLVLIVSIPTIVGMASFTETGINFILVPVLIAGIIFSIYATFSTQVLILEKKPIFGSLQKSIDLVKSRFLAICGRLVGANLILLIPYAAITICVLGILYLVQGGDFATFLSVPSLPEQILIRIIDIIFLPIFFIFGVVFYQSAKDSK